MPNELLRALLTIGFGALAGGFTNTVAIWMLFHPYRPPKLFGRLELSFLQGAIPRSQARLAAAIGRTVGNRLLTSEDLTRTFANVEFRHAFDQRLAALLDEVLHRERGSIREMVPEAVASDLDRILHELVDHAVARVTDHITSPAFEEQVLRRIDELVEIVSEEPIGDLLTPARGAAVEQAADEWLQSAVERDDFSGVIRDYLERGTHSLLAHDRTFEEILPLGLVASLERAIAGYLPLAAQRLGGLLEDPEARSKFESAIHDLLHRFLRDLRFHQRVVARLVVNEDTIDRVLDTIETEGAERLSEMLRDPAVQAAIARSVNEGIVDLLRRPVSEVLGAADDPSMVEARATLARWIVGMARDEQTRRFLIEKLHGVLERVGTRSWGEVLEHVPPERAALAVVSAARSEAATRLIARGAHGIAERIVSRPVGTPARWLPPDAATRLEAALGDPLWSWLQTQVPTVVQRIDVAKRVEEKVVHFPTAQMEELVRKVTERELRMIVRLGYVLGAVIGTVLVLVDRMLG